MEELSCWSLDQSKKHNPGSRSGDRFTPEVFVSTEAQDFIPTGEGREARNARSNGPDDSQLLQSESGGRQWDGELFTDPLS